MYICLDNKNIISVTAIENIKIKQKYIYNKILLLRSGKGGFELRVQIRVQKCLHLLAFIPQSIFKRRVSQEIVRPPEGIDRSSNTP